ncbi:ExeA family protein [Sinorhizobium meliloti]|uniref:ExeA family protein n=1 Tax=Rhizobium meliloti TaxID=382 RepID=UPI003BF99003
MTLTRERQKTQPTSSALISLRPLPSKPKRSHKINAKCIPRTGLLVVLSGLVGSGKTHLLRRIEAELTKAGKVALAKSLAVDKRRTSLPSLIEALFYDLSPGDRAQVKIPKQAERRERDLRDIMKKGKRPIVLVVDEAHDLHHKTLTGLKRLMEVVADAGVLLSVLLVGHPRLRNDLRRPQMEEIGYRTTIFEYEGIGSARRDYVAWLLDACAAEGVKVGELLEEEAIDLIAERLRTPLQIEMHLTLAFEQGFRLGAKPVTAEVVEQVLSRAIDDLEPTLTRNGYDSAALVTQLNARPSDIRAFLAGTLDPEHSRELTEQLRQAGLPV